MEIIKKGDLVKIEKVSDNVFYGEHPNGINVGYTKTGILHNDIVIGDCVFVGSLRTSTVIEIISNELFKTKNSTYKLFKISAPTVNYEKLIEDLREAERLIEELDNISIT